MKKSRKPRRRSETLIVRVYPATVERIKREAAERMVSVSDYLREVLKDE